MEVLIDGELYTKDDGIYNHPDFHKEWVRQKIICDLMTKSNYLKEHPNEIPSDIMEREPFFKYFWEVNQRDIEVWEERYQERIGP